MELRSERTRVTVAATRGGVGRAGRLRRWFFFKKRRWLLAVG